MRYLGCDRHSDEANKPLARLLFRRVALFTVAAILTVLQTAQVIQAQAANIYLAQNAAGSGNGADCNDALAYTFFNTSANWGSGSGKIGPGTTVHLCGTITGTAGQTGLTFQGSGTSGNPITLLFETGANLTAPYWAASGAIAATGKSNLVINGGTNGIIQNTQNGTGLTYQQSSTGIYLKNVTNVTVENLTVANICQHTSNTDFTGCTSATGPTGIGCDSGCVNVLWTHNVVHDVLSSYWYGSSPGDSLTISYSTTYRTGNFNAYPGGSGTFSSFSFIGNDISCVVGSNCNWDTTQDTWHEEALHVFVGSGAAVSGYVIADNYFHDWNGDVTGMLNFEPNGGTITNMYVYNNVFVHTGGYAASGGSNSMHYYNNTLVSSGNFDYLTSSDQLYNNIFDANGVGEIFESGATGVTSNNNDFYSLTQAASVGGTNYSTLAAWQSGSTGICSGGCDTNSIATNPNIGSSAPDFVPQTGSPVIGAGTNLTSLCSTQALLCQSAPQTFGVNYACGTGCLSRPASGPWDVGAFQASGESIVPPTPPSGLTASVQ